MDEPNEPYNTGVPLQNTEDHLARLLGRQSEESIDSTELTSKEERDFAIDDDDDDDSMRSNNLTPEELSDSTRRSDLFDTENENRKREGHVISPNDRG